MEEATDKQIKFMQQLGIEYNPAKFISKKDAREAIANKLAEDEKDKEEKPEVVKVGEPKLKYSIANGKNTTMYTSYAKDIFCSVFGHPKWTDDTDLVMVKAIELVKQAKAAFE